MANILNVDNLNKSYNGGKSFTVRSINFQIGEGEIVGLVGKNGAGKSTIIKSITGVLPFEVGKISICGFDVVSNAIEAKKKLGYVPDVSNAYDKMTGMEYLNFVADIFGVDKSLRVSRINEFQKCFPLGDSINKLISSYSHGMKQKISLMASLMSNPKLWILDEPTTGLDPQTTASLLDFITDYAKKGNAVMFSSHNLNIVEDVCSRVLFIDKGNLVKSLTKQELDASKSDLEKIFMEHVN